MWWCPYCRYDGLYMDHTPEDYDKWQVNKDKCGKGLKKGTKQTSGSDGPSKKKTLTLNEKMKATLMLKCQLSDAGVTKLLESLN